MFHGMSDVEHGQIQVEFFCMGSILICISQRLRLDEHFNNASRDITRQHEVVDRLICDRIKVDTIVVTDKTTCEYNIAKWSIESNYQQLKRAGHRSKYVESNSTSNHSLEHG